MKILLLTILLILIGTNFYYINRIEETETRLEERTNLCNGVFSLIQNPYLAGRQEVENKIIHQLQTTGQLKIKIGTTTNEEGSTTDNFIILGRIQ